MKYLLNMLRFPVRRTYSLSREVARMLGMAEADIRIDSVIRQAVDTRKRNQPYYDFTLLLEIEASISGIPNLQPYTEPEAANPSPQHMLSDPHPYIIGMGPAGLFCALAMTRQGLRPHLFDRGDALEARATVVQNYWNGGALDEDSNVQYGEGGAGAFSDGKLTSRSRNAVVHAVYDLMRRFGAPEQIAWEALPHLGTDGIRALVKNIRGYLIEQGCEFHYRHTLQDVKLQDGGLDGVRINGEWHQPEVLVLALGNAARDTWRMLYKRGVVLEAKPFAVGARIEHRQRDINRIVYGGDSWAEILGPSTYRLADKNSGVYSFCMCPGGQVIASASERDSIVTNGMSYTARAAESCNSALVMGVGAADYGSGLFDGVVYQRQIERAAWNGSHLAPAQGVADFLKGRMSADSISGSYRPGLRSCDISTVLGAKVSKNLITALQKFDLILKGFCDEAVLIAPETRASSPIRILRDGQSFGNPGARGIFPIGEGSGYAGGIMSSAVDGFRCGCGFRMKA